MKHTKESFAAYKAACTRANDLPLPIAYSGKKVESKPTPDRCPVEEKAKIKKSLGRGYANIAKVQEKLARF